MLKVLLFVVLFALAVYLLVRVVQRRGPNDQRPARRPQPPRRQVAPDDDPEFLRDLDRKRRHPDDPDV